MSFADEFLKGFSVGQRSTEVRDHLARLKRQDEWDTEDRTIEKDILQHRLRELKISEKVRARDAARQTLALQEGTAVSDLTPEMTEGGVIPSWSPLTGESSNRMAPVNIPGIEELGVPGTSIRPKTMEQLLKEYRLQEETKAETTPFTLSAPRGGTAARFVGDREIGRVTGDEELVPFTERDETGKETTRWIPESERAKLTATRHRLPQRTTAGGGGGSSSLTAEDIEDNVEGIIAGNLPPEVPNTTQGLRIRAALNRRGYNLTNANADLRALRSHYQAVNSVPSVEVRTAADTAISALTDLEDFATQWDASGFGTWNAARLALAKRGGLGEEAKELASGLEAAAADAQEAIALLSTGGSAPTNRALDDAAKKLGPELSSAVLKTNIARIKTAVGYRVNAIKNLGAVLPSQGQGQGRGAGAGTTTDKTAPTAATVAAALRAQGRPFDDATVKKVMANPEAMAQLMGSK